MLQVTLGRTGLTVNKNGFGALPVQRASQQEAVALLRTAYDNGINFYDTARTYSDSEQKLGAALADVRGNIILATKTPAVTAEGFWQDLHTSLEKLRTDYVDILQFHNPAFCPLPGDGTGLYEAMLEAKQQGKVRFIGLTNHRLQVAVQAADSGAYDTVQFPFSYLAGPQEMALVQTCQRHNVGFIAMKALAGGLITSGATAYNWMAGYDSVLPIWGVQHMAELEEFIACQNAPAALTGEQAQRIERDRAELAGEFCRGCGYCMPCPADIEINNCARISLMLRRAPAAGWLSAEWQAKMAKIEDCIECGQCRARCPYELDTPALLKKNYADYQTFL